MIFFDTNFKCLLFSEDQLAWLYNDESVLENHHISLAFQLLKDEGCNMFSNLSAKQWKSMRKMAIDMVSMKTYKCAIFLWHYFYFSHSHGAHDHWKSLFHRYWPQQTRNCEIVLYSQTCVNENALQSDDASCIVSVHRLWHALPPCVLAIGI